MKQVPGVEWWEFWNPGSGLVGGLIAGAILNALIWIMAWWW